MKRGKLFLIGIGPGSSEYMTGQAIAAIQISDLIVGYYKYIELLGDMTEGKEVFSLGMRQERERCIKAIDEALCGRTVGLISSGDSGIYGMAALVYELIETKEGYSFRDMELELCPGVTAAVSGAGILGVPLANDFCVISLSDQLTPWEKIEKRLECFAASGVPIAIYNPMSHHRPDTLSRACEILKKYRNEDTVCGWVRNIGRESTASEIVSLGELSGARLDMLSTVFIGGEDTILIDGRLVTKRGYAL